MKKLLVIIAVVALFAAPAAAVDWNFYGSARMATFYTSQDFGDGTNAAGTDDSDDGLRWEMQGNSRLGARVKGETVSGRVELSTFGLDGDDDPVGTRLLYGDWNFGAGSLRVGKSYSPTSQFISTQAFDGDLGLLGIGTFYGRRPAGLTLSFGGLRVALLDPETLDISTSPGAGGIATGGDVDSYLPKIEVGWGMAFDAFNFNLMGGFQTYTIEDVTPLAGGGTDDVDVTSWVVGADAGFSFGPAYVKGAVSLSQNPSEYNALVYAYPASANWDGDDDTDDTDLLMAALVAGFKMSDMVSFEIGGGMASYDTDCAGCDDTDPWAVYGNATIQLAPGVWIIPEAGYFDFDNAPVDVDDNDAGSSFYVGAKWQLDF